MEQERPIFSQAPGPGTPQPPPGPEMSRRLYRSRKDRVLAGVCGGLAHYFNLDPVLIRIAFVALALAGGAGILIYILAAIVIPEASAGEDVPRADVTTLSQGRVIIGAVLIAIGALLFMREILPGFNDQIFWAIILVALGLGVILKGSQR